MTTAELIATDVDEAYLTELEAWRAEGEAALRADWVSLIGRFELQPGSYRLGVADDSDIRLPKESAPHYLGVVNVADGEISLTPAPGVAIQVNGVTLEGIVALRSDGDTVRTPDIVTAGSLTFFVIERGPRIILRVRDANSPTLKHFSGRRWFPVDTTYRVEGTFTPYDPPKLLAITNLLGDTSANTSPGFVTFTLDGVDHRLDTGGWRNGGLVLHFRDATNGKLTYGGGRAVVTAAPEDGSVVVDFNRTTNLPCAHTAFATCPLPPNQNRLAIPIPAGELSPEA